MSRMEISDDRIHHILAVARRCYDISKEAGCSEYFARKMFMIGYLHDVGYEFSEIQGEQKDISCDLILSLGEIDKKVIHAIKNHGKNVENSLESQILNQANLEIDHKGRFVGCQKRLEDMKKRYGEDSTQYIDSYKLALKLKLIKGDFYENKESER